MKTKIISAPVACVILVIAGVGCNRGSRANSDANRAASPAEGGATSTAGSAGESKNFGDTRAKTEIDGQSPSASPTGRSKDISAKQAVETPAAGASTGPQQNQNAQTPTPVTPR
jgi:hypothetical protein